MQAQNNPAPSLSDILKDFSPWSNSVNPNYPINRYTLRRNIAGFPFAERLSKTDSASISEKISKSLFSLYPRGYFFSAKDLDLKDFHLLFEHLFLANRESLPENGGVFIDTDTSTIAILHLEDHLTMFFHDKEFNAEKILETILKAEEEICKELPFAYSDQFGYTTASAVFLGTGLTQEAIIHAPGINSLGKEIEHNDKVIVHGLHGEKEVLHDLVICSNKYCLGMSEKNINRYVDTASKKIFELESSIIEELKKNPSKELINTISKDYGHVRFCNSLEFHESLQLASSINLGIELGLFESKTKTLYFDLFFNLRRAHLEAYFSDKDIPIGEKRALLFQEKLSDIKPLFC